MKNGKAIALGGMLGAVAVTLMLLGGLIPASTYVCPVLCILVLQTVLRLCGRRIAWAWYAMVSFLTLLMGPDKEAAALLALLGYYPIVKPKLEKLPLTVLWKLLLFNAVIVILYTVGVFLLGVEQLVWEHTPVGYTILSATLLLGNATFFLLDKLLTQFQNKRLGR